MKKLFLSIFGVLISSLFLFALLFGALLCPKVNAAEPLAPLEPPQFAWKIPSANINSPSGVAVDKSGNVYVVDSEDDYIKKFSSNGNFMGQWGGSGKGEGQFDRPSAIAVDGSGNIYVADKNNNRIQKLSPTGDFLAKWGGLASGDGDGQFNNPSGIAVDGSGNIYVSDSFNHRIQKLSPIGEFLAKWGHNGSGEVEFFLPMGIAVDGSGNIYVADSFNNRIQKLSPAGAFMTQWESDGSADGQFDQPSGIAVDGGGNIYVTDISNNRVQKLSPAGALIAKWGSYGLGDEQFDEPSGIAVEASGNIYVADTNNSRIQKFGPDGKFIIKWGSSGSENGQFYRPSGIAVNSNGKIYYVYVVDTFNNRIQKLSSDGGFIDKWGSFGSEDGQFDQPSGMAFDASGNIYVTDTRNSRIQKFNSDGEFITQWGSDGSGDGQFKSYPAGIAVDGSGYVYVVDSSNSRIQKFNASGTLMGQWGGYGTGDGKFKYPAGIAIDGGYVYVVDSSNNRIQKFNATGGFITKWGIVGPGDGQFNYPSGIAIDGSGNVYVADTLNSRIQIFNSKGDFITKWGSYGSGDGQFKQPYGIAVYGNSAVYVTEQDNNRIQKFIYPGAAIESHSDISVSPANHSLDYGSLNTGSAKLQTVTITNTGTADLVLGELYLSGTNADEFSIKDGTCYGASSGKIVGQQETCTVNVEFKPTSVGVKNATLGIPSDDPDENLLIVSLTGKGMGATGTIPTLTQPDISVSLTSHDFGRLNSGGTKTQPITITNTGNGDLILVNLSLSGTNADEFSIKDGTCSGSGKIIAPQGECTFVIEFAPASAGAKSATLSISSNDPDHETPLSISITGTGTVPNQPDISVSLESHNFGGVITSGTPQVQTLTITNTGNAALVLENLSLSGTDAAEFSIQNDNCSGQAIDPNGTCTVVVKFAPTSAGTKNSTLIIPSNDPNKDPVSVLLTGKGTLPEQPCISVTPVSCDFGGVNLNSQKIQLFTIKNTGDVGLIVGDISINAEGVADFSIQDDNCSVKTIAPAESFTLEVKFSPKSAGAKSATLGIPSNDPIENPLNISLTGTGTTPGQPHISVTPGNCDFSVLTPGNTQVQTFTIKNIGDENLVLGNLSPSGTDAAEFSIQNDTCSGQPIGPDGTCTVDVEFIPLSTGAKSATLVILSNDPENNPLNISLTSAGSAPAASSGGSRGRSLGGGCFITTLFQHFNH